MSLNLATVGTTADAILSSYGANISQETIQLVQRARQADIMRSGINTQTGIIGYDLHAPAQVTVSTMTPVVNTTPRVTGPGIDVHHFKTITDFGWSASNAYFPGVVDENSTPSEITYTIKNLYNVFKTIAQGNSVSMQAQFRGRSLEGDVKARRMAELLYALKLTEEQWLIYASDYLWNPATPLAPTTTTTGGSVAANTYYISVSAFNVNGETFATPASTTITTTGAASTISITIFTQPAATGYNLYVGTVTGTRYKQIAANYASTAVPSQSIPNLNGNMTITLNSLTASGSTVPVANTAVVAVSSSTYGSVPLTFNGVLALIFGAGNTAYAAVNGAPNNTFTAVGTFSQNVTYNYLGLNTMNPHVIQPAAANGRLSYTDIKQLLLQMFLDSRADPDFLACSPADNQTVTDLLYNASNARLMIMPTPDGVSNLTAGARVSQFLNPTTNKVINVEVWPYLPQGTIIVGSRVMPFPVPGFDGPVMKVISNIDYMGLDFPPTKSNFQYGFVDMVEETLEISFLGGFGAITGVIPGTN